MLSSNIDLRGPNESTTLKEAMARYNWPEWTKTIENKEQLIFLSGS